MASEVVVHPRPSRVRRMRFFAVSFLFVAGIVNYLDRVSFSIANTSIRADLGLSATQIGALLSAFSLAYGVSPAADRTDARPPRLTHDSGCRHVCLVPGADGHWPGQQLWRIYDDTHQPGRGGSPHDAVWREGDE